MGTQAGQCNQQANAIALGTQAGQGAQGMYSVAIGSLAGSEASNSIVINASGSNLNNTTVGAFIVRPIAAFAIAANNATYGALMYDTTTREIMYSTILAKTFVIDHPIKKDNYLVHACLEGPESGVYYRGTSCIPPTKHFIKITLPDYVSELMTEYTVYVSPIIDDPIIDKINDNVNIPILAASRVKKGKFKVFKQGSQNDDKTNCISCYFDYIVFAKRHSIEIEPKKAEVVVKGDGPYTWL